MTTYVFSLGIVEIVAERHPKAIQGVQFEVPGGGELNIEFGHYSVAMGLRKPRRLMLALAGAAAGLLVTAFGALALSTSPGMPGYAIQRDNLALERMTEATP